jgi:ribokinase
MPEGYAMLPIQIIGSLNIDLTVLLPRFHQPGETITGLDFRVYSGGKGGNQAVAAARLGAEVHFIGMLGGDDYGAFYLRVLTEAGVDVSGIGRTNDAASGIALIEVDKAGENRIALVPGANALVDDAHVRRHQEKLRGEKICMLQLEIPLKTCMEAARRAHESGDIVILDPAPAIPLPDSFLRHVDFMTPNEGELARLTGMPTATMEDIKAAASSLILRGVRAVVAKLGANGCLYMDGRRVLHVPGFKVDAVDTTAAGDSFNAGLACALANDYPIEKALRFANAVGAVSTTGVGAQSAMPNREQVEKLMARGQNAAAR